MSMFTQFNGPQCATGPSTKSMLEFVQAYNELSKALSEHVGNTAPGYDVHGVKKYIEGIETALRQSVDTNAGDISSINASVSGILEKIKGLATSADLDNLATRVDDKADKSKLNDYAKDVDVDAISGTLDNLNAAFEKVRVAWNSYSEHIKTGDGAYVFGLDVSTDGYLLGHVKAKEYIDFDKWTDVSAQYAGATVPVDSGSNGLYVLGELSMDWDGGGPEGNSRAKSGRAYVKYVNSSPFDAIVDFTATYVSKTGEFVGHISQQTSRVNDTWRNLSFHLVQSTDSNGVPKVYLAVSADGLVNGGDSANLHFYVCGVNIKPLGSKDGLATVQGISKNEHIFCTHNLDSAETLGLQANKTVDFVEWSKVEAKYVPCDVHSTSGLTVPVDENKKFMLTEPRLNDTDNNDHFVIARLSSNFRQSSDLSKEPFIKQCLVYVKHRGLEPFEATVSCTVEKTTGEDGAVKWTGTVCPVVSRGEGKWRNIAFHLDLAANTYVKEGTEKRDEVYLSISADGLDKDERRDDPFVVYVCGVNIQPYGTGWSSADIANRAITFATTNYDRIVLGHGEEDAIYFTSRPIAPVQDENDPELGSSPLATLYDLYLAAVPVGGMVEWPFNETKTKAQVIEEGLEAEYMEHYGELWDDLPDGTVVSTFATNVPRGYHACDGSRFIAADYPELAKLYGEPWPVDNLYRMPVRDMAIVRVRLWDDGDVHNPDVAEVLTAERLNQKIDEETVRRENADKKLGERIELETDKRKYFDEEINSKLAVETEKRKYFDERLNKDIVDGLNNEAGKRQYVDGELRNRIAAEEKQREQQLEQLNIDLRADLRAEATTRGQEDADIRSALATETQDRKNADGALQGSINDEATTRGQEDTSIGLRIDREVTALGSTDSDIKIALEEEASLRKTADDKLREALATETQDRKDADGTLQGSINDEATTRGQEDADIRSALAAETVTRDAADMLLEGKLEAEATARGEEDTDIRKSLSTETQERKDADSVLQGSIDDEALSRRTGDTDLLAALDDEANTRRTGDEAANTRIDEEVISRRTADEALGTRVDNEAKARAKAIDDEAYARTTADAAEAAAREEQYGKAMATAEQANVNTVNTDRRVDALDRRVETLENK